MAFRVEWLIDMQASSRFVMNMDQGFWTNHWQIPHRVVDFFSSTNQELRKVKAINIKTEKENKTRVTTQAMKNIFLFYN